MKDVIYPVHEDKLPDDTTYRFIQMAVDVIADQDKDTTEDDLQEAIIEMEADSYTSELTAWLNERADHVYYLTEALETYGMTDGFDALSSAQKAHMEEVAFAVLNALKKLAE